MDKSSTVTMSGKQILTQRKLTIGRALRRIQNIHFELIRKLIAEPFQLNRRFSFALVAQQSDALTKNCNPGILGFGCFRG